MDIMKKIVMKYKKSIARVFFLLLFLILNSPFYGQEVPSPKEFFGFEIGTNYHLANYQQTEAYFKKLSETSDKVKLVPIGKTEEGRTMYTLIISSPKNLAELKKYKEISHELARANISEKKATQLIEEGKPVVWIDGGLHSNETVGHQQLIQTAYELIKNEDKETERILNDVIILLCEINPDGQDLVVNWYMKDKDSTDRNLRTPRLFNKYVGHDNNRDWYMNNLKETQNVSRQLYVEWMPQIVYNHHQSGPPGTVLAGPPYRGPFNYTYDPLVITGIDAVGAAMINRLNREDKSGYTRLNGSVFNTWWNGGMRTTPYYHNMIGLLTEIVGNPSPTKKERKDMSTMELLFSSDIPFVPDRLLANNGTPNPILPQKWSFKKSIDYSVSLNYAVLNYASRMGEEMLRNIYTMGKRAIAKGEQDTWTIRPKSIQRVKDSYKKDVELGKAKKLPSFRGTTILPKKYFNNNLRLASDRDPRGYIIPYDQPDFATATKFINALIQSGIEVYRATSDFRIGGVVYPAQSYIVKTNQAFRSHVLSMFEPQDYRNDFQYPGGPPIAPYDSAGWTLAFQMGIDFDRILDDFDGPFDKIPFGEELPMPSYELPFSKYGFLLDARNNNSYKVVNRLLKNDIELGRILDDQDGVAKGSFYVQQKYRDLLSVAIKETGVKPIPALEEPNKLIPVAPARVGLFDYYGGSIPSGWVRWIMEKFDYQFSLIYPKEIDNGNLASKYDVILFIDDGIEDFDENLGKQNSFFSFRFKQPDPETIPEKYRPWLGHITKEKSIPSLKNFLEEGGRIVTVGKNTSLAYSLGLPVKNALLEENDSNTEFLSRNEYYIPTSILKTETADSNPALWGLNSSYIVFNNDPVFRIDENNKDIEILTWFKGKGNLLESGWAWGQDYIKNGITSFKAKVGKGEFYAFSPEITFRAQSHGTFPLLFNQLYQ